MTRASGRTVGALLRWREFGESKASGDFGRCAAQTQRLKLQAQAHEAMVQAIQLQRSQLLDGPLDPAVLQLAAQIETAAWGRLEASQEQQATAQHAQDIALAAYVAARADTRVADARHERIAAADRDRAEKTAFDWMADLHMQTRTHRHD